jgi:glucokinase
MSGTADRLLLAGDVGGTKTDLAVVSVGSGPRPAVAQRRYSSTAYPGLAEMAREFLTDVGLRVEAVCVDVAGPVIEGEARLTNLPWRLNEVGLAHQLDVAHAWLLNDLVATASAVPLLGPDELHRVQDGTAVAGGAIAVMAPGTGLGEAFLTWEDRPQARYRAHASEGGHAAFAPRTDLELELLRVLRERFDHVSAERVASGIGIPNLYEFLRDCRGLKEPPALAAALARTNDRTRPILDAALDPDGADPLARATLDLFLGILGTETANLALKVLATGGIYLAGGIAQRLRDELTGPAFREALSDTGRFSDLMRSLPVHVVSGEVAVLGAAAEGLRRLTS